MDRITAYLAHLIPHRTPFLTTATAFAPSNIALCKYWGKRDVTLNLPLTSSLSLSLAQGSTTTISLAEKDSVALNGTVLENTSDFHRRLFQFLDLIRLTRTPLQVQTHNDFPTAAGLASSASGFAALILALNTLYNWQLETRELSLLARLSSGSACRSLWPGFVEWHEGTRADGLDSFAEPLNIDWSDCCLHPCILTQASKAISSRDAMNISMQTSPLAKLWPLHVTEDLAEIKLALQEKNFHRLGLATERNAKRLHELLHTAVPAINYDLPETLALKKRVEALRAQGHAIYFTQDAGAQIKLLYLKNEKTLAEIKHLSALLPA